MAEPGRQLVLASREPHAVFHHLAERGRIEHNEVFPFAQVLDEREVAAYALLPLLHLGIEVGPDLKDLLEILVVFVEHLVHRGIAGHDHFDVEVDCLGLERGARPE